MRAPTISVWRIVASGKRQWPVRRDVVEFRGNRLCPHNETVTEISDASTFCGCADEVFSPPDEAELLRVLRRGEPLTIMGALTGVTGGAVPQAGSAISMAKMNSIEILPGRAMVGPGALLRDVQMAAARSGQLCPRSDGKYFVDRREYCGERERVAQL